MAERDEDRFLDDIAEAEAEEEASMADDGPEEQDEVETLRAERDALQDKSDELGTRAKCGRHDVPPSDAAAPRRCCSGSGAAGPCPRSPGSARPAAPTAAGPPHRNRPSPSRQTCPSPRRRPRP